MKICLLHTFCFFLIQILKGQDLKSDSTNHINIISAIFSSVPKTASATLDSIEFKTLKEGDLLLRKGFGWISDKLAEVLNEEFPITHCGLILSEGYDELHILHSISNQEVDGVLIEPLGHYLKESKAGSLVAVRIKTDPELLYSVILESKNLYNQKIPFDLAFDDTDNTKLYCAELFSVVFKKVFKKDILSERISVFGKAGIRMRNFLNQQYFEILFNQYRN